MHRPQRSYFKLYDYFNILTISQVLQYKYDIKIKYLGLKIGVFNQIIIQTTVLKMKKNV